jgi:trans-aconitate methyltransferase
MSAKTKPPKDKAERKTKKKPPRRRNGIPAEVSSARKYKAWELRTLGRMTFANITKELNKLFPEYPLKSDHQAVEKMIKEAEKEYIDAQREKVDEIKAQAGVALDWVQSEAASAWMKSRDQIVDREFDEDDGSLIKIVVTSGNAQYLRRVTESVEAKTKIFGAQAPKKHEVTGKDGKPLVPDAVDFKVLGKYLSDGDLDILHKAAEIIERAQRDLAAALETGG